MALAPYAMDASRSRGRRYPEPPHPYRNDYARDRDRVIHSRAFRRLEAKTQVFTKRYSDHFRNRLTHTLEVAQIARTVAGALGLNTDLAEALALVHDIGHPPFGHAGERCLDELLRPHGDRFDHNLHALRIVEQFEQRYLDFPGLNLTFEVREGIIKHSREYSPAEFPELADYLLDLRPPLEAQLIDPVDEIAYNTADLDDGFEARLLDLKTTLAGVPLFAETYAEVERRYPARGRDIAKLKFNEALKRVLDRLATDLIENTREQIRASGAPGGLQPGSRPAQWGAKEVPLHSALRQSSDCPGSRTLCGRARTTLSLLPRSPGRHAAILCGAGEIALGGTPAPHCLRLHCGHDRPLPPAPAPQARRRASTATTHQSRKRHLGASASCSAGLQPGMYPCQTASDCEVKWNCLIFSAGSSAELVPCDSEPLTRSGAPISSTLPGASISSRLWLKRKLRTGYWIFPFSMSQMPSRVSPVCSSVRRSTNRRYQKRLTSRPRSVERIISSILAGGCALCSMALTGPGVSSLAFCLAQNRE